MDNSLRSILVARQIVTEVLTTIGVRSNERDRESAAVNVKAIITHPDFDLLEQHSTSDVFRNPERGVESSCPHLHQDFPGTAVNKCLDCGESISTSDIK